MSAPSEQTLLVTGANGFIGGHVLQQALEKGYHVRGLVRSAKSAAKHQAALASYGDKLSFAVVPDITVVDDYAAGFAAPPKPITGILHLASPFHVHPEDNKRDILDPAVHGAVAVLEAAKKFGGAAVRRVVLTSSFAAVVDLTQGYRPGHTYTEADWSPLGWETAAADGATAYCASKKLAERAAWDWVAANAPLPFDLVSINPPWVFGPHLGGVDDIKRLNESSGALAALLDAPAVPPTDFAGFADVRDVAAAHVAAFETPAAGGQRFLVGNHFDYQSAVDVLRVVLPELKARLPEGTPGAGETEEVYAIDGSKAARVLGLKYTPLSVTMKDSFVELLEAEKRSAANAA